LGRETAHSDKHIWNVQWGMRLMRCPADKWRHGTNGDMGNMDICGLMTGKFMTRESWEHGKRETYISYYVDNKGNAWNIHFDYKFGRTLSDK
jgi:hypothetical protein